MKSFRSYIKENPEYDPELTDMNIGEAKSDVKVGDTVHLGHGARGGTGVVGRVIKIQGNMVHIKNDKGDTFKGPMNRVSVKESIEIEEGRQPFAVVNTADNNEVVATASSEEGAKSIIHKADLPPMSIKDKSKLKIVKTRKKQHIGHALAEAKSKDIVKGLGDSDGPFTVVAIRNKKVIKQETTKMRNMLPAIVKTMRKDIGPGGTIAIEDKKGTIRGTFKEATEAFGRGFDRKAGGDIATMGLTHDEFSALQKFAVGKGGKTFSVQGKPFMKREVKDGKATYTILRGGARDVQAKQLLNWIKRSVRGNMQVQYESVEQIDEWWSKQANPQSKGWKSATVKMNFKSFNAAGEGPNLYKKGTKLFYHPVKLGKGDPVVVATPDVKSKGKYFSVHPDRLGLKGFVSATGALKDSVERDELKSDTLRSYLGKARKDNQTRVTRMADQPSSVPVDKEQMRKLRKRRKGSEAAASRLDARKHNLEPRLKREEVEEVTEKFEMEFADKETAQKFMSQIVRLRLGSATGTKDGKVTVHGPQQAGVGSPTKAHQQMSKIMKKFGGKIISTDEGPRMKKVFEAPKVKIKLDPKKKIGYEVRSVGPGGKTTVTKRQDMPDKPDVGVTKTESKVPTSDPRLKKLSKESRAELAMMANSFGHSGGPHLNANNVTGLTKKAVDLSIKDAENAVKNMGPKIPADFKKTRMDGLAKLKKELRIK